MSDIPTSLTSTDHYSRSQLQPRLVHTITDRFSMANTYLICEPRLVVVNPWSALHVHLLSNYMKNILHRPMSDIDLVVLTFLYPDFLSGLESLHRVCSAPIAAAIDKGKYAQRVSNAWDRFQKIPFDLPLEDETSLPGHPDWHVTLYPQHPQTASGNLFLYNTSTQELVSGSSLTVFEGNPVLHYDKDMGRKQLEELLKLSRGFKVSYFYPIRGRQLLRTAPFTQTRVD